MPFSHLHPLLTSTFSCLASWLHKRSALRLPQLLLGILFATGRRTVTSWFRAAAITDDFRPAYTTVCAVGRHVPHMTISTFLAMPLLIMLPLVLLIVFAVGVTCGLLVGVLRTARLKRQLNRLRREHARDTLPDSTAVDRTQF